jgi:hypothetical protein
MRHLRRLTLCVAIAVMLSVAAPAAWTQDINPDLLKKGMTLNDVVRMFGQPTQMEWVNLKGTAVLFLFYPTDKPDAVFRRDGRTFLPMGFVTDGLAGWGKEFYEAVRSPNASQEPKEPGDR